MTVRVDLSGVVEEARDVNRDEKQRRKAERMGLQGRPQLAADQKRHGVPQPASRAEGRPERVERTKTDEVLPPRVHHSHPQQAGDPDPRRPGRASGETRAQPPDATQDGRRAHGCIFRVRSLR
jgi:hypothetical protein